MWIFKITYSIFNNVTSWEFIGIYKVIWMNMFIMDSLINIKMINKLGSEHKLYGLVHLWSSAFLISKWYSPKHEKSTHLRRHITSVQVLDLFVFRYIFCPPALLCVSVGAKLGRYTPQDSIRVSQWKLLTKIKGRRRRGARIFLLLFSTTFP